jgi:tRNA (adenine57-N1/adenine58-N1)-methyltransferase
MSAGDQVLLVLEDQRTFLIELTPGRTFSTHKGAVSHDDLIGEPFGTQIRNSAGAPVFAVRPIWVERMKKVHRRTNIMYPKDVGYLLARLGIGAGDRVIELGAGSGAMTIALAHAVRPGGRVYSYDRREEFLDLAASNCAKAGVGEDEVEFRLRIAGEALEPDVDAITCDIPEPWEEVGAAHAALVGSGRLAAATPTFNQAERIAACLAGGGFAMVQTNEILVREILARPGRTRPAHRMVGHTQILTTGTKVFPQSSNEYPLQE